MASAAKQVFISYATEDTNFAHRLADDLKQVGARVWIAPGSILPGESWIDAIERGLRESSHVVIVLTPAALEAPGVKMERDMAIDLALEDQIKVISLPVKPCEVPLVLRRYHMLLAFQEDYDTGLNQLAGHLGLRVAPPRSEDEIVAPLAPEPTARKERVSTWQRLRLPLEVAGLLAIVLLIGVVASGLIGGGEPAPTATSSLFSVASVTPTSIPIVVDTLPSTPTSSHTAASLPTATATPTLTSQPPTPTPGLGVGSTKVREKDGMEMVYVPGGMFPMGSTDGGDDEQPVHSVTLDSFWIDKTEVTNAQYALCVTDEACPPPSELKSATRDRYYGDSKFDDFPVLYVSWHDANKYCRWAGGRLATEAEWEYAARGPGSLTFPWGNDPPDDALLNYGENVGDTTQVGSYPDGASWVGAMDMAGNVWEWVADWHGEYPSEAQSNPKGPEPGDERVQRGGSWTTPGGVWLRAAARGADPPNDRYDNLGFRCVVEPGD